MSIPPPTLIVPRGRPLTLDALWEVIRAVAHFEGHDLRVAEVAPAFAGAWPAADLRAAGKEFDRFATQLTTTLFALEDRGLIRVDPRLPPHFKLWEVDAFRVPHGDYTDPIAAFLDQIDRQVLLDGMSEDDPPLIGLRDVLWTPATAATIRIQVISEEISVDGPATIVPVITGSVLVKIVEQGIEDPRRRRGVDADYVRDQLGVDRDQHDAVVELLEQATITEGLDARHDGGSLVWGSEWSDSRRGIAKVLDTLGWNGRTRMPPRLSRKEIADATGVSMNALTTPVADLVEARLIDENEDRQVSAGGLHLRVLAWLAVPLREVRAPR